MAEGKAIKLSELLSDVRQCDVKWMEHEFWVKYKPSRITPAMYRETKEVAMMGDRWGAESIKVAVRHILIEWSIKDDQGVMVPIEDQTLDQMPKELLDAIYDACWENSHPLEKSENKLNGSLSSVPAPA